MLIDNYLVLNIVPLGNIQMTLDQGASVNLDLGTLAYDFGGVHNILEDTLVNRCKSPVAWPLLLGVGLALPTGLWQDAPESTNEHLWASELLL